MRALADKQYYEDSIFWNQYIFKYIYDTPEAKDSRVFNAKQAKRPQEKVEEEGKV